jgi:hypothetical protein
MCDFSQVILGNDLSGNPVNVARIVWSDADATDPSIDVAVRNLSPTKVVGARYTTDDWASSHDVYGTFEQTMFGGIERWVVNIPCGAGESVQYAVFCFQDNLQDWDNNFGQNYVAVAPVAGSKTKKPLKAPPSAPKTPVAKVEDIAPALATAKVTVNKP